MMRIGSVTGTPAFKNRRFWFEYDVKKDFKQSDHQQNSNENRQ